MKKVTESKTQRRPRSRQPAKALQEKLSATVAAIDQVKAATPRAAKVISLLNSWLTDESGYDEEAWPQLKKALDQERARVGARGLFHG